GHLLHPGQVRRQGADVGTQLLTLLGQRFPHQQIEQHQYKHQGAAAQDQALTRGQPRLPAVHDPFLCTRSRAVTPSLWESAPCRLSLRLVSAANLPRSFSSSAKDGSCSSSPISPGVARNCWIFASPCSPTAASTSCSRL